MKFLESFQRNEVRGRVTGISFNARGFDNEYNIPLKYEMRLSVKCTGSEGASDEEDTRIRIYSVPELHDVSRREILEVGHEYIFKVYPFEGYNFLIDFKKVD